MGLSVCLATLIDSSAGRGVLPGAAAPAPVVAAGCSITVNLNVLNIYKMYWPEYRTRFFSMKIMWKSGVVLQSGSNHWHMLIVVWVATQPQLQRAPSYCRDVMSDGWSQRMWAGRQVGCPYYIYGLLKLRQFKVHQPKILWKCQQGKLSADIRTK